MKLREYFSDMRVRELANVDKSMLFEAISAQTQHTKTFSYHLSYVTRYIFSRQVAYGFFGLLILFFVYGTYFMDQRYLQFGGLRISNGWVQAIQVAQIVDFEGEFHIEQNWKKISSSLLSLGDVVTLLTGSSFVMHIDDSTQATLAGPAQFTIQEIDGTYTLMISYGSYLAVHTLSWYQDELSDFRDIISFSTSPARFAVQIDDVRVAQSRDGEAIEFEVLATEEGHVLNNKWSDLLVQSTEEDMYIDQATTVSQQQVVAIASNDIRRLDDPNEISRALANNDLTRTVSINLHTGVDRSNSITGLVSIFVTGSTVSEQESVTVMSLSVSDSVSSKTISLPNVSSVADRNVIDVTLYQEIDDTLDDRYLFQVMKNMYIAYLVGDQAVASASISELLDRVTYIYLLLDEDILVNKSTSIADDIVYLGKVSSDLADIVQKNYYFPPHIYTNLKSIYQRSIHIVSEEYASMTSIQAQDKWNTFFDNLSPALRFQ